MDEEVDESLGFRYSLRQGKEEKKKSSIMSMERNNFDFLKDASLDHKKTFVQVMSLDSSERNSDSQMPLGFDERRQMVRNSNNEEYDIINEKKQAPRTSSIQRKVTHDCCCEGECVQYHCSCFNSSHQLCLLGQCCQNCIIQKNKKMRQDIKKIKFGCQCKKHNCLKSYCSCFQSGNVCNQYCECKMCQNRSSRAEEERRKRKQKASATQLICNCKKSHCLKKYCSCFSEGRQCSERCCCEDCRNVYNQGDDIDDVRERRERYGRIESENDENDIDRYFAGSDYQNQELPKSMEFQHPNINFYREN